MKDSGRDLRHLRATENVVCQVLLFPVKAFLKLTLIPISESTCFSNQSFLGNSPSSAEDFHWIDMRTSPIRKHWRPCLLRRYALRGGGPRGLPRL